MIVVVPVQSRTLFKRISNFMLRVKCLSETKAKESQNALDNPSVFSSHNMAKEENSTVLFNCSDKEFFRTETRVGAG